MILQNNNSYKCIYCEVANCKKCESDNIDKCVECFNGMYYSELLNKCVFECVLPEVVDPNDNRYCKSICLNNCKWIIFW